MRKLSQDRTGRPSLASSGSLTNLAKYPASTVQILGAEKALFRALKTKGNTPKVGPLLVLSRMYTDTPVRSHLPLWVYWTCRRKAQGKNITILGQQVFDCVPYRLFLW